MSDRTGRDGLVDTIIEHSTNWPGWSAHDVADAILAKWALVPLEKWVTAEDVVVPVCGPSEPIALETFCGPQS